MVEKSDPILEWTGERYVPQMRGTIALEHLHRYAFASEYVQGLDVLDIASGEGYGSEMLSRTARHVYGVDIDEVSVTHAQRKYQSKNLEYRLGSCTEIPLLDSSVDIIVSFETIEHITDHEIMMLELKRVLRPGGVVLISSPEKNAYDDLNQNPNPYHIRELNRGEFKLLLAKHFKHTALMGQRVLHGSVLVGVDGRATMDHTYDFSALPATIDSRHGLTKPVYLVAICSDQPIKDPTGSLCEQDIRENEYYVELSKKCTDQEVVLKQSAAQVTDRDQWLMDAKSAIDERDLRLIAFAGEIEQKNALHHQISEAIAQSKNQIATLEALATERDGQLEKLKEVISAKDSEISILVKEQQGMDALLDDRDDEIRVLSESLTQQVSWNNQLSGKIDQVSEEISTRNNEVEDLSKRISAKDDQIAEMERRMISLERRVMEKDNTIRNLTNQVLGNRAANPDFLPRSLSRSLDLLSQSTNAFKRRLRRCSSALRTHFDHRESGLFDRDWYLEKNPDVRASGMNPWRHFLFFGISENRSPRRDFQPEAYLRLNLDVATSHLGPVEHYMSFGWKEGRPTRGISDSYQSLQDSITAWVNHYRSQLVHLQKTKKTVLLVTHEISRTGAPILVLNLAEKLRKYYTVIVLSLGGGTLIEEFTSACDLVIGPLMGEQGRNDFLSGFFRGLLELHPIDCAVVNSIVSTPILKPLWENNIPTSHLIHEFSSYTRPETTFNESAFYSAKQIFSSKLILENALLDYPKLALKSPIVIPQGRCRPPLNLDHRNMSEEERSRLDSLLRPSGSPDNLFVVIGLGTVQLRKGVDLFLECAHKVSKLKSKVPVRFVWFGHGYNVKLDGDYSVYLHDQIKRSGIEQMCAITHETDQLDYVYETADLLFLSSRLDPLPLVSQDMMAHGKPVLCFEKATGLAEFLVDDPAVRDCVIDYMDVEGVASRIVELANDHAEYQRVGKALNTVLEKTFNLDSYTEKIHEHCEELMALEESKREDHRIIKESGLLDEKYFRHPAVGDHLGVKAYMALWSTGLDHRKPFAGFHPGIFAERNGVSQRDPLAEYIRQGKPPGPWVQEVISPVKVTDEDLKRTIVPTALHLHLYYPEMADSILARVARCKSRPDLLISIGDQESLMEVEQFLRKYELEAARIAIVPNRGRDIGPLLTEFGRDIIDHYEIIGHLHSKKTKRLEDQAFVEEWVNFLFGNLVGDQEPMMDTILKRMGEDPSIGLIYADDPYVMGWGSNEMLARELLQRLKIPMQTYHHNINFPIGTMFWGRTRALLPLLGLHLDWEDYPEEPLPYDGTILHAIERILPIISENQGFKTLNTNTPNLTR